MRRSIMADEESPSPPPECFICTDTEPAPRRSACRCTDRYVHDACLIKMLETSAHAGCPVCATPYANVSCTSRLVAVRVFSQGVSAFTLLLLSPTLLWCACLTFQLYCCGPRQLSMPYEQFVIFAAFVMAISGLMGITYLLKLCVVLGPTALARSALVHKRIARVSARAWPSRVRAEEFELATADVL